MKLVRDHKDPDILSALDIYEERIPPSERFEAPDIVRWLREDQEQRASGRAGPRDYFVIAKSHNGVCGFTLVHFYAKVNLAFVAYLVAEKGTSCENTSVSQKVLDFVYALFNTDEDLKTCGGFVLEVDDPLLAQTEEEQRRRLARIRLFCMLGERNGLTLRGLDFDYRQPHVYIPEETEIGNEVPMLLMYAQKLPSEQSSIAKHDVEELLHFICDWLYPEGFSNIPEEISAYRNYLARLRDAEIAALPERVRALGFAQIRSRRTRARTY